MGVKGGLEVTAWVAMMLVLASCSRGRRRPAPIGGSEDEARRSAASYLALLDEGRWPEAWKRLTEHRKSFWNGLARAMVEGPNSDYPDIVVRSLRGVFGTRAAPTSGYELFGLASDFEAGRNKGARLHCASVDFGLRRTTRERGKGIARLRIKEYDIEMRLKYEGGSWLVDGIAGSDEYSDEGIAGPSEEFEIFLGRSATVPLPKLKEEGLEERFRPYASFQVDSSGSVYAGTSFIPKTSLQDLVSWYAYRCDGLDLESDGSGVLFRWEISSDLRWGKVSALLAQVYRGGWRRLVFGVEGGIEWREEGGIEWRRRDRGVRVRWKGKPLPRKGVLHRDLIDWGGVSAAEIARLAHRVEGWSEKMPDGAIELSISRGVRWEDALRAIFAVEKSASTLLVLSVLEQGEGAREQVSIYADEGRDVKKLLKCCPSWGPWSPWGGMSAVLLE